MCGEIAQWKIVKCDAGDYDILVGIWERSVRATHDFLNEEIIDEIRSALITDYFTFVDLYGIVANGTLSGFIGLSSGTIEMLFIDSAFRNKGYGSALIDFAKRRGATKVDVNEQNRKAFTFYKSKGFYVIARDETDADGRPFPIIHLSL